MSSPRIVLASTSPYRRQLLARLLADFSTVAPDFDESAYPGETPARLVERLAEGKARSVVGHCPRAIVIGSDQVAVLGDRILTKPGNHERAREQLAACSGRTVTFETGVCVLDAGCGAARVEHESSTVSFRALAADEIERYLQAEAPYDCAGSIRCEGYAVCLFEAMSVHDPAALIGLPLIRLARLLRAAGVELP